MNRLKELRKQAKLSLRELDELSGISYSTLSEFENGKRIMSMHHANALSNVLGTDPYYILGTDAISFDGTRLQGYKTLIESMIDEVIHNKVVDYNDEIGKKFTICSIVLSEWIDDKDTSEILDIVWNMMERNKKSCE
jgi:transcriptional regulator with XRE-family HTH domain